MHIMFIVFNFRPILIAQIIHISGMRGHFKTIRRDQWESYNTNQISREKKKSSFTWKCDLWSLCMKMNIETQQTESMTKLQNKVQESVTNSI